MFPPKNERTNSTLLLWNLRSTCFRSFFGGNWRHQNTFRNYLTFSQWKSNQKNIFVELIFFSKNLLPVDPCPQNSNTEVTLEVKHHKWKFTSTDHSQQIKARFFFNLGFPKKPNYRLPHRIFCLLLQQEIWHLWVGFRGPPSSLHLTSSCSPTPCAYWI